MKQRRLPSLDALRVFASVAVVVLHVGADASTLAPNRLSVALSASCRWAVPVFLVTSGFLLARKTLGAPAKEAALLAGKRALLLYSLYVFWAAVYIAAKFIAAGGHAWHATIAQIAFTAAGAGEPLWFLPALALCTLVGGFLITRARLIAFSAISLVFAVLSLTGVLVLPIDRWLVEFAPFTTWLTIFLAGMLLALLHHDLKTPRLRGGLIALSAVTIALAAASWAAWPARADTVVLVVGALAGVAFVALATASPKAFLGERLQSLGPYVLGIFLVHGLVVRTLIVTLGLPTGSLAGLLVIAGLAWLISLAVVSTMSRFGWTRRLVSVR
jgi:peptidoglycan/LPS O-acetylase OafA/YrhL